MMPPSVPQPLQAAAALMAPVLWHWGNPEVAWMGVSATPAEAESSWAKLTEALGKTHACLLLNMDAPEAAAWAADIGQWPQALRRQCAWVGSQPLADVAHLLNTSLVGRYLHHQETALNQWACAQWFDHLGAQTSPQWPQASITSQMAEITNDAEIDQLHTDIRAWGRGLHHNLNEFCTALLEAVTNGVYHAPAHGQYEKCQPYTAIDTRDTVTTLWQETAATLFTPANAPVYHATVIDQWGRLEARHILSKLARHFSDEGLLDTSGRGHFLMTQLLTGWMVAIHPNHETRYLLWQVPAHEGETAIPLQQSLWILD